MIGLLLKLGLLRRIIVLIAGVAGTMPHWVVTMVAILGCGSVVGAGAVLLKKLGPPPSQLQPVVRQETTSPFLLAVAGLLLGGIGMVAFMVATGR